MTEPSTAPRTAPATHRSSPAARLGSVVLLAVLGVGLPVAIAAAYGALEIPRNDSWAFLATMFQWSDTGVLDFNDWGGMTFIGQMLIGTALVKLVGNNIAAVSVLNAVVGLVGLVAVAVMGSRLGRPRWGGVFVAATVAVGPLWMSLAPTFMTDVPAFAFAMVSLAVGVEALRREPMSIPLVALALVIGLYGFAIRQYAIVAPTAVVASAIWMSLAVTDRRRLRALAALAAWLVVLAALFLLWHNGLTGVRNLGPSVPTPATFSTVFTKNAGFFRLTGLMVLPVVMIAGPIRLVRRSWRAHAMVTGLATAGAGAWLVVTALRAPRSAFVGNYLARDGVGSRQFLSGVRPDLAPDWAYGLLVVAGSVGAILLVLTAVPWLVRLPERARRRRLIPEQPEIACLGLAALGYVAANTAAILAGLIIYDRYALVLFPIIGLLVVRSAPPRVAWARRVTWLPAATAFGVIGLVGIAVATDSASFDAARWQLAEEVAATGVPPAAINGGFEWVHYQRVVSGVGAPADPRFCVVLSVGSPDSGRLAVGPDGQDDDDRGEGGRGEVVATRSYSTPLHGPVEIVARRTGRPCPA